MPSILERTDDNKVKDIDKDVKNKFKWSWLERDVSLTLEGKPDPVVHSLGDCIRKVDIAGKIHCTYCDELINYASRGVKTIQEHCFSKKHKKKLLTRLTNYQLSAGFKPNSDASDSQASTYGILPQLVSNTVKREEAAKPLVPLCDRIVNSQALILGTIAEHSMPFTMAPVIVNLAKELAKDKKALSELSMDRTTASYKMNYGMRKTIKDSTLQSICQTPFSLNIDEATSQNHKKILTVLVSYFCKRRGCVVLDHLESLEMTTVDAISLYNALVKLFEDNNIPWKNLVSVLMDSAAVMRGSKNGLEQKLKQKAPHLVDIDGDICHHIHNACKVFTTPFDRWVEQLLGDLFNDFKWSPDLKDLLSEVCEIIGLKFTMPERFVNHRWLSCYDVCQSTLRLWDAFVIFYFGFLSKDRADYHHTVLSIYNSYGVSKAGRQRLREIRTQVSAKKLTADGQKRKDRIVDRVFFQSKKTLLIINFYVSVLPLLKKYVKVFQTSECMVHKLHDEQEEVFRSFLACYVKQEQVAGKSAKQLKNLDIDSDKDQYLSQRDMFLGTGVATIIKNSRKDDSIVISFMKAACAAYIECGKYLQKKLPLANPLLRALSSIDPKARGHSVTARELKALGNLLPVSMTNTEKDLYEVEVNMYNVATGLPAADISVAIDQWWSSVIQMKKFDVLPRVIFAALSIFHGPLVESSFNVMGDVIDERSGSIKTETYSSYQTVKYWLRAGKKTAVETFTRKDILHDPVERRLCLNMRGAAACYKKDLKLRKEAKLKKLKLLEIKTKVQSKKKSIHLTETAQRVARLAHLARQKRKARQFQVSEQVAKRSKTD